MIFPNKTKVLITGANGFVGRALCARATSCDLVIKGAMRSAQTLVADVESVLIATIDGNTDWSDALQGINVIVHLAARVHIMHDHANDPLQEFRKVNVDGTVNLAKQAVLAGVKRFVFISSIKVNGESTPLGQPFQADDLPLPVDAYGLSKYEAENA
ncbi:MAG: NAD-dependent epimerase/dehydratase family protein, partial [Methylococcales bacterium]